jgi:hypothetical protein
MFSFGRDVDRTRRSWHRLTLALASSLVAASSLLPSGAGAVPSQPDIQVGDDPNPAQSVPSCTAASWSSPVVKIHVAGFGPNQAAMVDAIRDVNAQIAEVGGSSVRIESTVTTTEAFHLTPYNDHAPVIHVGFQDIFNDDWAGVTNNTWSCEHFITFDNDEFSWNYGTPEDAGGAGYYKAGLWDLSGNLYFRVSYQHELLHAFRVGGGGHPDDVYSFLNYGSRPWAHAPVDAMIRPLPYDVKELRRLFPASGSRTEVAVLNTWMVHEDPAAACAPNLVKAENLDPEALGLCDTTPPPDAVTSQKMLCAPSAGDTSSAGKAFTPYCGAWNATAVCPGSIVQVHYALANYSTADVSVTSNMWLSLDDVWDQNDYLSPTSKTYSVVAASAQNKYWGYEVPSLPLGLPGQTRTFSVIIRATATTPSGVTVRDSIPMRGTVSVGPECLTATHSATTNTGTMTFP